MTWAKKPAVLKDGHTRKGANGGQSPHVTKHPSLEDLGTSVTFPSFLPLLLPSPDPPHPSHSFETLSHVTQGSLRLCS